MRRILILIATVTVLFCIPVPAESPSANAIKQLTTDYLAKRPTTALHAGMNLAEARGAQSEFVAQISNKLGKRIGYKVGLISKAAQEGAGASGPARGVLLADMMLPDGAEVSVRYGARPIYEPDLIVVVKDEGINDAKTISDVVRHLSEVVAFIELPDRIVAETEKLDGNLVTAINVGARLGVLGQRVKVQPTPEFVAAMENMAVTATDQTGAELAKANGKALLGHPFNVVLWLIQDLASTGEKLKPGDLISLGTFAAPKPPQAGQTVTVRYEGLPGGQIKASVRFRE